MARGVQRFKLYDSREACKRLRAGEVVAVQKFAAIDRAAGDTKPLGFIVSDDTVDRYGDTIAIDGWSFESFTKNPVMLWAHDYGALPLGRWTTPWKTNGNRIKAEVETWATPEENAMAPAVESMLRRGLLNAVSVGFLPSEFDWNEERGGVDYTAQELLEISVVPVPANANALLQAKQLGLWVPEMDAWVERQMDVREPGLCFDVAQRAWSALKTAQVQVREQLEAEPLPEVLELTKAVRENTAAQLELVQELRFERDARAAADRRSTVENAGAVAAHQVLMSLKK